MNCPRCQQDRLAFDWSIGTMVCQHCGYRLYEDGTPDGAPATAAPSVPSEPQAEPTSPAFTGEKALPVVFIPPVGMDLSALPEQISDYERVRMRGHLEAAMYALARGNRPDATRALRTALDISPDFADAWLQLAVLADNAVEQRVCLEHVLASQPGHSLALSVLARLDGRVPEHPVREQESESDSGPVATRTLRCPNCGGGLAYDPHEKDVTCRFCSYLIVDADDLARTDRHSTLLEGNLKRKTRAVSWNIGQRWLHCTSCGAVTTLTRSTLTSTCRFCGSQHLIQENVRLTFEQPDLIVPFTVSREEALAAVEQHLKSGLRVLTRLFADAVARIDLQGSYLPFWVFDADMIVNWSWSNAPSSGRHPVLLSDVPYLAVDSPPRDLLEKIEPYDLRRGVDYDARLLASFPARLYALDLTRTSIDVRQRLTRSACRQAEVSLHVRRPRGYGRNDDPGSLETNAYTQFMTYRFALLPVWIGALIEEDGDRQPVLVNGQTGKVALGKLQKEE